MPRDADADADVGRPATDDGEKAAAEPTRAAATARRIGARTNFMVRRERVRRRACSLLSEAGDGAAAVVDGGGVGRCQGWRLGRPALSPTSG
mmetsp:Transcript_44294/g.134928  ORF Transcript_44294/g.134928 Transcript_44294/m.134928 type:complete len:92 (+) Transcript_44294:964-1239(+)